MGPRDAVVFLQGCTRTSSGSESCVDLTPAANGAIVQSSDSNPAVFGGSDYVLHFPVTTDLTRPQLVQAKANGYISANGKLLLNPSGPSYVKIRLYAAGTKAGGSLNSISTTEISDLSVTPPTQTITGGTTLTFTLTANGGAIANPTVNVTSLGGDTVQKADGTYEYTAGNVMGTFHVTFSAGTAQAVATVTIEGYQQTVDVTSIPPTGITVTAIDSTTNSSSSVTLPQGVTVEDAQGNPIQTVQLTIDPVPPPWSPGSMGAVFELGPEGTQFTGQPATVTLSYDPALLGNHPPSSLEIGWFDSTSADWLPLPGSTVDTQNQLVSATTSHFTPFAPRVKLVQIDVSPATASVIFNGTKQYTAMGTYSDGLVDDITSSCNWSVSPNSLGNISNTGLFTANSVAATGTISAKLQGQTDNAQIDVQYPPLVVSPESLRIFGDETTDALTFTATQAGFTSFTASTPCTATGGTIVATVSPTTSTGVFTVTPVTAGACTITVTGQGGQTAGVPVTVTTTSLMLR